MNKNINPADTKKKDRLHIAMLLDIPFDTGSWVGRYMPLAYYLGKRGHNISVLLPAHNYKGRKYSLENAKNVVIYETGIPLFKRVERGREHYTTIALLKIATQNILRSIRFLINLNLDVILVCKPLPMAGTTGILLKLLGRKKVIVDCDDYEITTISVKSHLQRKIVQFFEYLIPKLTDMVTANTEYTIDRISRTGVPRSKIVYLPNGVDIERFNKVPETFRKREFEGEKVILYCGDLCLSSGHSVDLLLQAFKILLPKCPSAMLLIIGDGRDEGKLHKFASQLGIASKILWTGRLAPEEVPKYMGLSHVVVDPVAKVLGNLSRCPVKILEAMYLGKPVVTSDIGDRKKLLGDFGFFAEKGNPYSMADKMLEAIENIEFKKNRDLVIKRALDYSWDKLTDKVEILLKQVLAK